MTAHANPLETIGSFLEEIGTQEKAAADKAGMANTEAGSIGGETSHPVKDVDDRTDPASEGERSSENSADVKEDQGKPAVDNTPEATAKVGEAPAAAEGTAADDQLQIGTNKQPTGDDPSNETSSAKGGKEDGSIGGASSHPARTDNDSLDGHKYAEMPLEKLAAHVGDLGNDLCAGLALGNADPGQKQAETAPGEAPAAAAPTKEAEQAAAATPPQEQTPPQNPANIKLAEQVGWELAGLIDGSMDKQAADVMVQNELYGVVKQAEQDATNVAAYLTAAQKQAEEGEEGVGGGEEAPAEGGGEPPMAAMGGEAAPPAPEAPVGAEGGGDGGGEALLAALAELGITPDQLLALLEGGGEPAADPMAGGGDPLAGGGDPMAGGDPLAGGAPPPPMDPAAGGAPPMPGGMEVAAADKLLKTAVESHIREIAQRARANAAAK